MKIERNLIKFVLFDPWHISLLRPATDIPVHIVPVGVEPTARYHHLQPLIKNGCIDGLVAAQRVANGDGSSTADKGQLIEQVQTTNIIPDRFHGATLIAKALKIRAVFTKVRISRNQYNISQFYQLTRPVPVIIPEYKDLIFEILLAESCSALSSSQWAENRLPGSFRNQYIIRYEQESRYSITSICNISDKPDLI